MVRTFCIEVLEEWKGWVTGSLPMAVIAVIALIKPDIAPLPLWAWALLIFVAGFVCAVFRVYRKAKSQYEEIKTKLDIIGLDRPLAYHNGIFNFNEPNMRLGKICLQAWGIYLDNLSDKMLKYEIKDIWLENSEGKRFLHKPAPDSGTFISAKTKMTYSLLSIEDDGMFLGNGAGTKWTIGFEIEYDNIPPVKRRTMVQRIQYTLTSLAPLATGNTILYRDER